MIYVGRYYLRTISLNTPYSLVVAFKGPGTNEDPSEYENREETARNIRILGPVCIFVGITMVTFAAVLKYLSRKAQDKQTRIGFYCPVHGDFYPLSPGINPRKYSCKYVLYVYLFT